MTGKLEKELIKATKFKPPKEGYNDRQEELKALARLSSKLPDDDFDDLTDEAGNWVNAAVKAIMAKTTIKDFTDDARSTDEADAEAVRDAPVDEDDDKQEHKDSTDGDDSDAEADAQAEADAEADNEGEEAEEAKPNKAKAAKKAAKPAPTQKELKAVKTRYDDVTGELDRYGVIIGTKTHDALKLYERGVTAKELLAKLGGRFYNILRKVSQNGHLVERSPEGVFTVVHKDNIKEYLDKRKAEKATKGKGKKK